MLCPSFSQLSVGIFTCAAYAAYLIMWFRVACWLVVCQRCSFVSVVLGSQSVRALACLLVRRMYDVNIRFVFSRMCLYIRMFVCRVFCSYVVSAIRLRDVVVDACAALCFYTFSFTHNP